MSNNMHLCRRPFFYRQGSGKYCCNTIYIIKGRKLLKFAPENYQKHLFRNADNGK